MLSNPVAVDDLETRWRPLTSDEEPLVAALLDDAWAILNTLAPIVGTVDDDSPLATVITSLVCASVLRVMRNPDGNKSESIDDYSFTRDDSVAAGSLYYTDNELELVRGVKAKAKSVRFSNTSTFF